VEMSQLWTRVDKEGAMHTETTSGRATTQVLKQLPSLPQTRERDHFRRHVPYGSEPSAAHDAMLLVAALDELEARRLALEWLLENDLLCACLV